MLCLHWAEWREFDTRKVFIWGYVLTVKSLFKMNKYINDLWHFSAEVADITDR